VIDHVAGARREADRRSVFFKLVAIMIAMAISLLAMVSVFFWLNLSPYLSTSVDSLSAGYARAIAATSPGREQALRDAHLVGADVRYEGPDGTWTTDPSVPSFGDASVVAPAGWTRAFRARISCVVPGGHGGRYLFTWDYSRRMHTTHLLLLGLLLALMTAVVHITHVVLRGLLRPLVNLGAGVRQVSAGDLDVRLPEETNDEFGALTRAFNQMARRVREMVRARDQLLLDVSHELRSPLTRMKVALEMEPPGANRDRMAADLAEMSTMVTELLELERLRGGGIRTERRPLAPLLRDVVDRLGDRGPGVQLFLPDEDLFVPIDSERMRTVFRNLIENAVKYALPDSRPIAVRAFQDGHTVTAEIVDDGPGIPAEDLAQVFEPFFRVDRSRSKRTGGYGLGLSICQRVVAAHGGMLSVRNNAGRGATFTVTLPAARA
jgi:signal transduction histidine kinase